MDFLLEKFKKETKTTDLYFVDYRDCFSDEQIQKAIHNDGDFDDDFDWDLTDTYEYYLKEVFDERELEEVENDSTLKDNLIDYMNEVDTSTPQADLLKNTGAKQLWYYTGIEVAESDLEDLVVQLKAIGINHIVNERAIRDIHEWNYYGGELQIFFKPDLDDLINRIRDCDGKQVIVFSNPCIGLTDTSGGSGGYAQFIGDIEFPFNPKNIFVGNEGPGYSLMEVYGDEIGDSEYSINDTGEIQEVVENEAVNEYGEWDKLVKAGSCSSSDPRWGSHNYSYQNAYPAGWTCSRCGKFIID